MSKDFDSAQKVLQSLLFESKSPLAEEFFRWRLWRYWDEVAGATIAANSRPVKLHNGILYVWVKNSSWMQQLVYMAKPIKGKINQFFGSDKVKMVRFTMHAHEVPDLENAPTEVKEFLK
jgi:predicted nucleic acid-binding Zn ribbon protein